MSAFTPPKAERDVLDRQQHFARGLARPRRAARCSCGSLHRSQALRQSAGMSRIATRRRQLALPLRPSSNVTSTEMCAVFDHRRAPRQAARSDRRSSVRRTFMRARQFAVVGIELLRQNEKAPDLRARHRVFRRQRAVHLVDVRREHLVHLRMRRRVPDRSHRRCCCARPSFPPATRSIFKHHADEVALVAERHRFLDVRIEFQLVLDDISARTARRLFSLADILGAVDDFQVAGALHRRSRRRRCAPSRPSVLVSAVRVRCP